MKSFKNARKRVPITKSRKPNIKVISKSNHQTKIILAGKVILIVILILLVVYILHTWLIFNVNPKIANLNKADTLSFIKEDSLSFILIDKLSYDDIIIKSLKYPIIFKPDYCNEYAHEVELIKNYDEAINYINRSSDTKIIIQEYHPGPFEATIFYKRNPYSNKYSITVSERKNMNKDNKEWLWKSNSSHKYNLHNVERKDLETEMLKQKIHEITSKIPDVYYGRYDVRFSSHNDLANGKNFKIIEFNGFDATDTRRDVNNDFKYNIRLNLNWQAERYKYGLINIMNGRGMGFCDFWKKFYLNLTKIHQCNQQDKIKNGFETNFKSITPNRS